MIEKIITHPHPLIFFRRNVRGKKQQSRIADIGAERNKNERKKNTAYTLTIAWTAATALITDISYRDSEEHNLFFLTMKHNVPERNRSLRISATCSPNAYLMTSTTLDGRRFLKQFVHSSFFLFLCSYIKRHITH